MGANVSKTQVSSNKEKQKPAQSNEAVVEESPKDTHAVPKQIDDASSIIKNVDQTDVEVGNVEDQKSATESGGDIFMTEIPQPWIDVLNEAAETDLWAGIPRNKRPEWAEYLKIAEKLAMGPKRQLRKETKMAIFGGDVDVKNLPPLNSNVTVFISSTFTDTKAERNHLMKDVYPYLREICQILGLEFATIDMRWGVTDEATKHHRTVQMCVEEILKCTKESCGPAFLCFLSHKYGYRPVPATIPATEYESILAYLINNQQDTNLIKKYYKLDKNAIEPEYVLSPMPADEQKTNWWKDVDTIQEQMREAVLECFRGKPKVYEKYFSSVTEIEIQNGAFENKHKEKQCLFVVRKLQGVQNKAHQNRKLVDMKETVVDNDAQGRLKDLIDRKVPAYLPKNNIHTVTYPYRENVSGSVCSVKDVCDSVCKILVEMIFENFKEGGNLEKDPDLLEIVQHLKISEDKRILFIGREKELANISNYLSSNKNKNRKPLVVIGSSGSGKTSLMAVAAKKASAKLSNSLVVTRFIGTTNQSDSARNLLFSVSRQIAHAYEQDVSLVPGSYRELIDHFWTTIADLSEVSPLIIFLDSLDQLSADDNGRRLEWLKLDRELPVGVKFVLSSTDSEIISVLEKHIPKENFIHVPKLLPGEGPDMLKEMLRLKCRKLTEKQTNIVMDAFVQTPLPLYLRLSADVAMTWKSYDLIESGHISGTLTDVIKSIFRNLEEKYGETFVRHALSYITASKHGLSNSELEDVLSCDDKVLDTLFQYWKPPMRRIPSLVWARVKHDLGQYLTEKGSDGTVLVTWFHRQFYETAREMYLKTFTLQDMPDFNKQIHLVIADYFDDKWAIDVNTNTENRGIASQPLIVGGKSGGERVFNRRKIRELPFQLLKLRDFHRISKIFLDLSFIEAKFQTGMGLDYYAELTEAARLSGSAELIQATRFIGSNLSFLLREPSCVYQLASQQRKDHTMFKQFISAEPMNCEVNIVKNGDSRSVHEVEACELTLQGHGAPPLSCDISPKGDRIVSSSVDGCLIIWDVLTGAQIATNTSLPSASDPNHVKDEMQMHVDTVNPCCYSRDGETIATGTDEGEIILFDSEGTKMKCEPTENNQVTCIQYSPDDLYLASGFRNGKVYLWKASNLEHTDTIQLEQDIVDVDFSTCGKYLAAATRLGVARFKVEPFTIDWHSQNTAEKKQKKMSRRAERPELVLCCCYHPSGERIMTGSADNHIGVWETTSGECVMKLGEHPAWIWSIKFTKDGQFMFSSSSDRTIKLWQMREKDEWDLAATFYGHSHRVVALALADETTSRLVSASLDCSLKVWDVQAMKVHRSQTKLSETDLHYNTIALSPSGLQLAKSKGWSQWVEIQPLDTVDDNDILRTESHPGFIKKAEFMSDGSKLVALDYGHLGDYMAKSALRAKCVVYNAMDCKTIHTLDVSEDGLDGPTSFVCGRSFIVVGTLLGSVLLFDIATYQLMRRWKWEQNVSTLSYCHVRDHVAGTSGSNCIVWKIRDNDHKVFSKMPLPDSTITTSVFSPDGLHLVTGVDSGKIYIWKVLDTSVQISQILTNHISAIKDITFSKSGNYMVSCADLSVRIYDVKSDFKQKSVYFAPVNCAVFVDDSKILAGDSKGTLMKLDL